MEWEYRHLQVGVKDLINSSGESRTMQELAQLARQGWEVDQVIEVHTHTNQASTVLFRLKRKLLKEKGIYADLRRPLPEQAATR